MRSSVVTIDAGLKAVSKGVLYSPGGFSSGKLHHEYNLYDIERACLTSAKQLPAGKATIGVESTCVSGERLSPLDVTPRVNGRIAPQDACRG